MKNCSPTPPQLPQELFPAADAALFFRGEEIADTAFRALCFPPLDREHVSVQGCRFTGCRFPAFALRNSQFTDTVFRNCDLSNACLQGCSFHRVEFIDCRLAGTDFSEGTFAHALFGRCKAEYVNFTSAKLQNLRFEEDVMRQASMSDCRLDRVAFERCDLVMVEFFGTRLQGISLADCDIRGIRVREIASYELGGVKITPLQAAELARLLGVEIEQ